MVNVDMSAGKTAPKNYEILPVRVSRFDELIERGGIERSSTILISGGCGTGKSTFAMQSLYNGALNGERGIYLSFEEPTDRLLKHMEDNYGWNLTALIEEDLLSLIMVDPFELARSVEAAIAQQRKKLLIEVKDFTLPFVPDRVAIDSITALSSAFLEHIEDYRTYIRHLFKTLSGYGATTFAITETEQEPHTYSRLGVEEFLSDGVIVLYNMKTGPVRQRALEILKLRCSAHSRRVVPYEITQNGIDVNAKGKVLF